MKNMNLESQNIAIAEACGWKVYRWACGGFRRADSPNGNEFLEVPDYINDLNAMHEAEKMLAAGLLAKYTTELLRTSGGPMSVHFATAAQRAEAFLKTLNLWNSK